MTRREMLEELRKFPTTERIAIIEAALHLIHEDMQKIEQPDRKRQLAAAAEALLPAYSAGGELTTFTALDHEDFHT